MTAAAQANPAIVTVTALTHRYGALTTVDGLGLEVTLGARHGLIGANGAGKTTLLNLIAGTLQPHAGQIRYHGREITGWPVHRRARAGIGRTHQTPAVLPSLSVVDNIVAACWTHTCGYPGRPGKLRRHLRAQAMTALDTVGLDRHAHTTAGVLSHGQRRLLELAAVLASRPRLLLLDEPAAGLTATDRDLLTRQLTALPHEVTVLLVEHHLDLVAAVCGTVTVLHQGRHLHTAAPALLWQHPHVAAAYPRPDRSHDRSVPGC
ncbi:ATP-binding cassette domain-containing protein [Dactylosporangium sp. NBC_01737]|uniref:ABC transporter ATP-binding protein n=1 Tax=Dactylosporangium sp. NBC_01737 TaxID=2975959 RepID=UPI002E0DD30F|nr:ATP-binding cassette domain-containing protein [Dactylosporangium sp. NBC_01737]